jgi:hypothetical protein
MGFDGRQTNKEGQSVAKKPYTYSARAVVIRRVDPIFDKKSKERKNNKKESNIHSKNKK